VRRAEDGIRTWAAEPGEYYHSFTGEYGGLWRRIGRAPNVICGVGFIAQGFDVSSYYRRAPDAANPRAHSSQGTSGWIIAISASSAAVRPASSSIALPPSRLPAEHAALASSENHNSMMMLANEEFMVRAPNLGGDQK